jgi:hypothetical protein
MIIVKHLHVRCVNKQCPRPADAQVPVPEIAPGVIAPPVDPRCASCDHPVKKVDDDA